jgi:hypothetical protein
MGKGPGEFYSPSPPPMFFDILACIIGKLGHNTSFPRPIYDVHLVQNVLEGSAVSGKQVQFPTPACTPFDPSKGLPYPPNSLWTKLDGI